MFSRSTCAYRPFASVNETGEGELSFVNIAKYSASIASLLSPPQE
jgi:hypothetical protein